MLVGFRTCPEKGPVCGDDFLWEEYIDSDIDSEEDAAGIDDSALRFFSAVRGFKLHLFTECRCASRF